MRNPSLHVTKSELIKIINHFGNININNLDEVMKLSRRVSPEHRSLQVSNKKQAESSSKRLSSTVGDANLLADIIYSTRIQLKHLGVTKIKQTDTQWANVKELATIINDFCEAKELDIRDGYIKFISIGLKLIAKANKPNYAFCAKWMVQKASWIISEYESIQSLNEDKDQDLTLKMHNTYTREILDRTGISNNYTKDPSQMLNFIKARDLALELGSNFETYIQAQFFALEFCNGIPSPKDIHGDKAKERLIKYISENNLTLSSEKDIAKEIDWSKFKN